MTHRSNRGGLSAVTQHNIDVTHHHMTDAQKDQRILALAAELGLPEIEARKTMLAALASVTPTPALNEPPETITEPFTIMLWGITSERVKAWLGSDNDPNKLMGMAASPGLVEGLARVLRSADDLHLIQQGEILVTPVTAPSWAPVFGKIKATVTDIGGMMSHAAIVCREYGFPAVTGTGNASSKIKTGMRLRVDGSTGEVTIIG